MNDYQTLLQKHNILAKVQEFLSKGEEINAIKLVKDTTGFGLKESKDIVDGLLKGDFINKITNTHEGHNSFENSSDTNIEEQVKHLLQQNRKLDAIKLMYDSGKMNLKDSKNFVENIERKNNLFKPNPSDQFDNSKVEMTNINGRITVQMRKGNQPERIIYPDDPDWETAKAMLGNKPELLVYEKEFFEGKHPVQKQQSTLFVENKSSGKWILFIVLFGIIMLLIYIFYYKNGSLELNNLL